MSAARKSKAGHYSLQKYKSEAKGDPFVLDIDDEKSLTIPRPTGQQLLEVEEAMRNGTSRDVIKGLCGEELATQLLEITGSEDAQVLRAIGTDIQEHFGLGE